MGRKVGVVLSYILMIFEVMSTLLLTPFIISTLGQAEYGVYKLVASVTAYLLLLDLGVGNAVVRYVSKFKEENNLQQSRKFLGVCLLFYSVIAFICLLLGGVLIYLFPTVFAKGLTAAEIALSQKLLALTTINAAVALGTSVFNNYIIGYSRFKVSKGASIIQICIRMLLTVLALKANMGSVGIVAVNLLMTVICKGFYAFYVLFKMKILPLFKGLQSSFIKEVVIYSSFILLQMIATQINSCADQVLLGIFVSGSSILIGIYGVGAQVTQYFQSIGAAFNGVLMPGIVASVEKGASSTELQKEMIRIGRFSICILSIIWVGFFTFGKQFITLWAGKDNFQAYYVALILMTAYLIINAEGIGTQILWALNKHKEQSILKIAIVLLNIILTIILIKWRPILGATIGTFISLILGDVVVMNIVFKKYIGINLWKYYYGLFKGILPCTIISGILGFAFSLIGLSGWWGLIINLLFITSIYVITMFLFGFNKNEKHLILEILIKVLKLKKFGGNK